MPETFEEYLARPRKARAESFEEYLARPRQRSERQQPDLPPEQSLPWYAIPEEAVKSPIRGAAIGAGSALAGAGRAVRGFAEDLGIDPDVLEIARMFNIPTPGSAIEAGERAVDEAPRVIPVRPGMEDSLTRTIGEAIGTSIPGAAAAAGGFAVGGPPGAAAAIAAYGGAISYEEAFQAVKEQGGTDAEAKRYAQVGAAVGAITEPLGGEVRLLKRLMGGSKGKALKKVLEISVSEGLEEGVQSLTPETARQVYDENRTVWDGVYQVGASALLGGTVGAFLGGIAAAPNMVQAYRASRPREAQQPAPEPLTSTPIEPAGEAAVTASQLAPGEELTAENVAEVAARPIDDATRRLAVLAGRGRAPSRKEYMEATGVKQPDVPPAEQRSAEADAAAQKVKQEEQTNGVREQTKVEEVQAEGPPEAVQAVEVQEGPVTRDEYDRRRVEHRGLKFEVLSPEQMEALGEAQTHAFVGYVGGKARRIVRRSDAPSGSTTHELEHIVADGIEPLVSPDSIPKLRDAQRQAAAMGRWKPTVGKRRDAEQALLAKHENIGKYVLYPEEWDASETVRSAVRAWRLGGNRTRELLAKASPEFAEAMGKAKIDDLVPFAGRGGRAQEGAGSAVLEESAAPPPDLPVRQPIAPPGRGPTSIKNAVVDQERAARGLPPLMTVGRLSDPEAWDIAEKILDADPVAGHRLVAELVKTPRAPTKEENALLLQHKIAERHRHRKVLEQLSAAYDANDANDAATTARLEADAAVLAEERDQLEEVGKLGGTIAGRSLQARKMVADEDFSLVQMVLEKRASLGRNLTPEEHQQVAALSKRVEDLEAQVVAGEAREEALRAERAATDALAATKTTVAKQKRKRTAAARAEVEVAWQEAIAAFDQLSANPLDPALVSATVKLAKAYVNLGVAKLEDFVAEVVKRVGQDKAQKANDALAQAWSQAVTEATPTPRRALDDANTVSKFAQQLAEFYVGQGVTELDPLIDSVHAELRKTLPGITRRDAMDAISGYGQFTPLSKDAIKVQLRDLKGQMQQVAKLEDMQAKKAPLKTGQERRTPSDKERRLIAQVNEAKKKGGFVVTDPARQLRTALDASKRRIENQIADLEQEIATRERIVKQRNRLTPDAALTALQERRDKLRAERDAIFGRPQMTEEQRLHSATAAAERSIAEYEERIAKKDIGPRQRLANRPVQESLQLLRDRRDALKAELHHLRDLANPKKTPEERAQSAWKANLGRRIADYQGRLAEGDFAPRIRKPVRADKEIDDLRFQLEKAKAAFLEGMEKDRLARRSLKEEIFEGVKEAAYTSRAIITAPDLSATLRQAGPLVISHPIRAARLYGTQWRSYLSEKAAAKAMHDLENRPNYPLYLRSGLAMTHYDAPAKRQEEVYMGRWARKIPGVSASARAYHVFLNLLRADLFDVMVASTAASETQQKPLANFLNVFTGRGNLLSAESSARLAATALFSPRLLASRFQILTLQPIRRGGDKAIRLAVAKEYARMLIGITTMYAVAHLGMKAFFGEPGDDKYWDLRFDPRSSDFGKLRIGRIHIDPLAGLSQVGVLMFRLANGMTVGSDRTATPIRGEDVPFGKDNAADILTRFVRTKLAPVPGAAIDWLAGENVVGESVTPLGAIADLTVPMVGRDIYEAIRAEGVPAGVAAGILAFHGIGVQTYEDRLPKSKGALRQILRRAYQQGQDVEQRAREYMNRYRAQAERESQ